MRTRFAPSPTGPLHLGHAYSAILAHDMALAEGGEFLLRIEDIDQSRARPEWEELIHDDLRWLGLSWEEPVMRQSERMAVYDAALDQLWETGFLYPCTCTRRDIAEALAAPQEGATPTLGPDGPIYPGTCRPASPPNGLRPKEALRLNMLAALRAITPSPVVEFSETGHGPDGETGPCAYADHVQTAGDVVLARRDMGTSITSPWSSTMPPKASPTWSGAKTSMMPPRSTSSSSASWASPRQSTTTTG